MRPLHRSDTGPKEARRYWTCGDRLGALATRVARIEERLGVTPQPVDDLEHPAGRAFGVLLSLERRVLRLELETGIRKDAR